MGISRLNPSEGGIPFGDNDARPASPIIGTPYFNGEIGRLELYTNNGWSNIVQDAPAPTSIGGNYIASNESNTISIFGAFFAQGASVYVTGTDDIEIEADAVSYVSAAELSVTLSGLSSTYEPYDIKVVNPSTLFGLLPTSLYVNETPLWTTTSGSLGSYAAGSSVSTSVSATDPDGTSLTYSVTSGSLPSGLLLNSSSGAITGTASSVFSTTTSNFTIRASDGVNHASRSFSITIATSIPFEYLVIGGGGGGGGSEGNTAGDSGGGGGAGAYRTSDSFILPSQTYTVTVGTGGAGGFGDNNGTNGSNGVNSVFATITAIGGGGGGTADKKGLDGGSGGGSAGDFGSEAGIALNSLYGKNGSGASGGRRGGGGGGAGVAATNENGGAGLASSITGSSVFRAGGGAANRKDGTSAGVGGNGGGGDSTNGLAGAANTGSGGGSSFGTSSNGGAGGTGVVILAYPSGYSDLTVGSGLTFDQPTRTGYKVYRFTAGTGSISF
jgi:hypothetical protein